MEVVENNEIKCSDITSVAEHRLIERVEGSYSDVSIAVATGPYVVLALGPLVQFVFFRTNQLVTRNEVGNAAASVERLFCDSLSAERLSIAGLGDE